MMIRISCLHEVPIRSPHFPMTVDGPGVCGADAIGEVRPRANDGCRSGCEHSNRENLQGSHNGRRGSFACRAGGVGVGPCPGGHRLAENLRLKSSKDPHSPQRTREKP